MGWMQELHRHMERTNSTQLTSSSVDRRTGCVSPASLQQLALSPHPVHSVQHRMLSCPIVCYEVFSQSNISDTADSVSL
jgi:hypothetical protein